MLVLLYAAGASLLATSHAQECTGDCLPAYEFCQDNPNCCPGNKCIRTVSGNAKCWPDERRPLFSSWDGTVLTCGEPSRSYCEGACLPAYEFCQENPNCCPGTKCIKTVNGNAKCWPDERRPLFSSWDGGELSCDSDGESGGSPPGSPAGSNCEGACLPAYEFCQDNPNCCPGTQCIKTVNGNAKCWPDSRRPLFTSWDGGVLTCDGDGGSGSPPPSSCEGECLPAYSRCEYNPNCCAGSKCIKTVSGNAKCWPDERRPLFTSWDGGELTCGSVVDPAPTVPEPLPSPPPPTPTTEPTPDPSPPPASPPQPTPPPPVPPTEVPTPDPSPPPPPPPPALGSGTADVPTESVAFGQIELGASESKPITFDNPNNFAVGLTVISCSAGGGAAVLSFELPDSRQIGCSSNAQVSPPLSIPPGALNISAVFEPNKVIELEATFIFKGSAGNFGTVTATGVGGDPFALEHTLHPVIEVDPLYLVPPGTTFKYVYFFGQESHTHGPGDFLDKWEWKNLETGAVESTDVNWGKDFPLGTHSYELTVTDQKGASDSAETLFTVASEDSVEGTYIRVYNTQSVSSLPSLPRFAQATTSIFSVSSSAFSGGGVVRMSAKIVPADDWEPNFSIVAPNGGNYGDVLVLLDGSPPSSGTLPGGQEYDLDVRVQIPTAVTLRVELNGAPISYSIVDVSGEPPIINAIVSGNSAASGASGALTGFLLREPATLTVGGKQATITEQTQTSLLFTYPDGLSAGENVIKVTRSGLSSNERTVNVEDFSQAGPQGGPFSSVPKFAQKSPNHKIPSVDLVVWCNGHMFAASAYSAAGGTIHHYTCNENWDCTFVDSKAVSPQPFQSILGLACDPWENDANLKLWFAHNHLYAQGGAFPDSKADYKGRISYVEWFKPGKPVTLVVSNLAVSNHDHAVNDLGFLHDGDLLITTASNTNAGIVAGPLGYLPENPTSTGIWRVKVRASNFNGDLQYDWLPNAPTSYVNNNDADDQRYGEWAQLVSNPNFSLYAAGARNPFGLEIRSKGKVLMTENGPNFKYGKQMTGISAGCNKAAAKRGPGECEELVGPDPAVSDTVRLDIKEGEYYGTPNAARCRKYLITGQGNPDECTYYDPNDMPANPPACPAAGCTLKKPDIILESSLGGPFEYISYAFGGSWFGQVFIPSLQSPSWRYNSKNGVAVQDNKDPNYPYSPGVDAQQGPGGAHIYASFNAEEVKINVPVDATADEAQGGHGNPSVYDMAPMKSAVGLSNKEFIIGGINFNNMQSVTVSFGGITVTPSSVGSKWIKGLLPTNASPNCNVDVEVDYTDARNGSPGTLTLPGIFCWLPSKPSACSSCT